MELKGSNVVVTGASQGIGAAIAEHFATAGANVLVVARSEDKLAKLAGRIGGRHLVADLSVASDVDGLVQRCLDELGSIDVWVNNAGVETHDSFADVPRADVRQLTMLNFEAPVLLTHDVLQHMLARKAGHVVQMSSVAGAITFPGLAAYAGSKAGITNFTETLRLELAGTGIGLTVISPGPVDTDMWDRLEDGKSYATPALKRFKHLLMLPKMSTETIAARTVQAVAGGKAHVRLPRRYAMYHLLNNAPRRIVAISMTGVKLRPPRPR